MKAQYPLTVAALLLLPTTVTPSIASTDGKPDGETVFRQRCQACHSFDPARPAALAPNLIGVVGRKAASTSFNYSPALKQSGLTWTKPNLDKFLAAPMRVVPGTRMVVGIPDPGQRAAVVDYLASKR